MVPRFFVLNAVVQLVVSGFGFGCLISFEDGAQATKIMKKDVAAKIFEMIWVIKFPHF